MKILREQWSEVRDPEAEIRAGHVWVDGFPVTNPGALVERSASIALRRPRPLAGEAKLEAALSAFPVEVADRVAVDVGAAAGGFSRVLLRRGARRVYAVDAGHGQLVGSLRQAPRCINLEATNLARLDETRVPEVVDLVTIDVSYISLAAAAGQLEALRFATAANLIALVKPMYELGLARLPDPKRLPEAIARATRGLEAARWSVKVAIESPVRGGRGAVEGLIYAVRSTSE